MKLHLSAPLKMLQQWSLLFLVAWMLARPLLCLALLLPYLAGLWLLLLLLLVHLALLLVCLVLAVRSVRVPELVGALVAVVGQQQAVVGKRQC